MQSKATTVRQYLSELPADRRVAIQAVRDVILQNLDKDYEEGMSYGAIGYYVPHRVFPAGYHCDPKLPLPFAGLGSQKNHMSVGMMSIYGDEREAKWLREQWAKTGKRLDMGKCCIRFKKLEDLPLDVIGEAIRRTPAKKYIAHYEAALLTMSKRTSKGAGRKKAATATAAAKKPSSKKAAAKKTVGRSAKSAKSARSARKG